MNPKKILIFSTAYYPLVGGAEVAIKEITDRITGVQFDLITAKFKPDLPKFEKMGNVNIYRLGIGVPVLDKLFLPFLGAIKTLRLNSKNSYGYFWCMMATFASGAGFIANIIHFWKPVPIILTLQEGDSEEHFKNRWLGLINLSWWLALKNTKILTVLSLSLAERARKFGYRGEIKIIPNGVNINKFSKNVGDEEKYLLRQSLGMKKEDTILVTVSRLVLKNGVEDVIKALPKLSENIKFVILGEGELRKNLEDLAKKLGVSKRVIFKGFVSHDEISKYLKTCNIFIRTSLSEGFGNSFIEAMACKIPVIATPVGGIVDFLVDPSNTSGQVATGYFCQPQNPESIAKTVERIVSDPNKNKVIENAYKMVEEKYDWNIATSQMKAVFDNINNKL